MKKKSEMLSHFQRLKGQLEKETGRRLRRITPHDVARRVDRPGYIETGDDTTHPIRHIGDVPFRKEGEKTCIKNVLHVPTITKSLVSVGQIVEQGMQVRFNNEGCFIEKDGRLIAKGRRDGRLFILDSNEVKSAMYAKGLETETSIELWHKRIGHINLQRLRAMQSKEVVIGLPPFESKRVDRVCEACQLGKQHRHAFPKERNVSKGLLDVIHSDVWGPAQTPTLGGCRYYVTFIDDHSHYAWIFPMKKKSEVLSHFQRLKSQVEKETGRHIRCLRSDRGRSSLRSSPPTSKVKAFGENSHADTFPNQTE